jgi:thiol-disulfide isomerase/thioredoxin
VEFTSDAAFAEDVTGAGKPTVVLFKRPNCNACAVAKKHMRDLESTYGEKIAVFGVDTTMNPKLASMYVDGGLPVTVLFDSSGGEVWRRLGASVEPQKVALFLDELL